MLLGIILRDSNVTVGLALDKEQGQTELTLSCNNESAYVKAVFGHDLVLLILDIASEELHNGEVLFDHLLNQLVLVADGCFELFKIFLGLLDPFLVEFLSLSELDMSLLLDH